MGYSQAGLVPVCEMPYAKYLDCAADLFFEAVITHWCTAGRQKDGLVLRLQGFDTGVFGVAVPNDSGLFGVAAPLDGAFFSVAVAPEDAG